MKEAFIRSKHFMVNSPKTDGGSSSEYAVEKAGEAARETVHDTFRVAGTLVRRRSKTAKQSGETAGARQAAKQKAAAAIRARKSLGKRVAAATEKARKNAAGLGMIAGGAGFAVMIFMIVMFLLASVLTSGFGLFFSPEANKDSEDGLPGAVSQLDDELQRKIDGIKASVPHDTVELYGARAAWKDVLAVYAVKTTTDPANAMEVATMDAKRKQALTEVFWEMNKVSYDTNTVGHAVTVETVDAEGNKAATTGVQYYTTLIITVSHMTADEAADAYAFNKSQKDEVHELLAMDNSLWMAVLYGLSDRDYGEYGAIVQVALSQIGNAGGEPYWSWYGYSSRVEWCACFVSWCADQCGYLDELIPKFAWCPHGVEWFRSKGRWLDNSAEPEPGMIIFYDWSSENDAQDGEADHTGIVEYVENGVVHTIEGNWGDSAVQREIPVGYFEVLGYGYMAGE